MAVSESQLDVWSRQGSVSQSRATYATIRNALEARDAAYAGEDCASFLQGSYGNDTNIYADSDVDIVFQIDAVFHADISNLPPSDLAAYNAARTDATYGYREFHSDVATQLRKRFPGDVEIGRKAIRIKGNGSRRDTDVLVAVQYRNYSRFTSWNDQFYVEGLYFWSRDGQEIINYPKVHSANCTGKHQQTNGRFKPTVRIFKNMRNAMIDKGYIAEDDVPSYFLEGLLYNVPSAIFAGTHQYAVANSIRWLSACDRSKLLCANEQYYLCHPTSAVTWRTEMLDEYLSSVSRYWLDR